MTKMRWSIRRSSGKYSGPPSARRGRAAACLFVRNRMRKGSGERKGERRVASFLNNTSITPRA